MLDFEELKNAMANLEEEEVLAIMEEITEDTVGDAVAAMLQGMDLMGKLFDSLSGAPGWVRRFAFS